MESVSFYRFAAAIMQLLEPERYSYNQQQPVEMIPLEAVADVADSQSEEQTVAAVAEHLTQAIENASKEEIVEVAKVLEQSNLIETDLTKDTHLSGFVAEALVQNAVTDAATKTIKEIKGEEAITLPTPQIVEPQETRSFWEYYPELDESQILYADTVRYLYGYADRNSLFDYLNPEINLSDRQAIWSTFTQGAQREHSVTSFMYDITQKSASSTANQTSRTNDEQRAEESRKQTDARLRMIAEQREASERAAENRKR